MASLSAPTADGSNDTQHVVEGSVALDAQAQPWPDDAYIPPERWLHSETVDELRKLRARIGLPVPRNLVSVPRPPFTAPVDPFVGEEALDGIFAVRQESRLSELFGVVTETVGRQVARVSAALIAFLSDRSSRDGTRLGDQ